jgi:hypothetical protein
MLRRQNCQDRRDPFSLLCSIFAGNRPWAGLFGRIARPFTGATPELLNSDSVSIGDSVYGSTPMPLERADLTFALKTGLF